MITRLKARAMLADGVRSKVLAERLGMTTRRFRAWLERPEPQAEIEPIEEPEDEPPVRNVAVLARGKFRKVQALRQ